MGWVSSSSIFRCGQHGFYDALGQPTDVVHSDGQSIHYGYDPNGNRTSLETQIDGVTETDVDYTYDALNRVQTVTDSIGTSATTTLSYSLIGQLNSISRPNGVTSNYTYDPQRYFVDEIEHLNGSTVLGRYEYDYDDVGNRTDMTVTAGDGSVTDISYDYDRANRLIEETYNLLGAESSTFYQYDRAGNRSHMITGEGTTHYIYNANDELTRVNLPNYHYELYEYDARGNLTDVSLWDDGVTDIQVGSTTNYGYNAKDQMVSYGTGGTPLVTYDYDHMGNRVTETIGGIPTYYLWDEFSRYKDVILETGDNAGNLYRKMDYVLANGILIAQTNAADAVHYFLQDAQNSTIALADSAGIIGAGNSYSYNAFGELQGSYDPLGLGTNYLYTGQYFDADHTELYNLRARQYNPSLGRFTSRDAWAYDYGNPVELNRYVYTANNPATLTDPSGYTTYEFSKTNILVAAYNYVTTTSFGRMLGGLFFLTLLAIIYPPSGDYIDEPIDDTTIPPSVEVDAEEAIRAWERYLNSNPGGGPGGGGSNPWWFIVKASIATAIATGTLRVLCALLCPKHDGDPDPSPTQNPVTPTPSIQPSPSPTPDDDMRILYHGTQTEITGFSLEDAIANQRETHITDRENPGIFFTDDLTRAATGYGLGGWTIRVEVPKDIADPLCQPDDGPLGTGLPEWVFRTPIEIAYLNATFDIKPSIEALRTWFFSDPLSRLQECPAV